MFLIDLGCSCQVLLGLFHISFSMLISIPPQKCGCLYCHQQYIKALQGSFLRLNSGQQRVPASTWVTHEEEERQVFFWEIGFNQWCPTPSWSEYPSQTPHREMLVWRLLHTPWCPQTESEGTLGPSCTEHCSILCWPAAPEPSQVMEPVCTFQLPPSRYSSLPASVPPL